MIGVSALFSNNWQNRIALASQVWLKLIKRGLGLIGNLINNKSNKNSNYRAKK